MAHLASDLATLDVRTLAATPFYCEENVWQNLQRLPVDPADLFAVFISNRARAVVMWSQRAAAVDPIVWDYHVVVVARGAPAVVVDVDCTAGAILPLADWLEASFDARVPAEAQPRFRVIERAAFLRTFSSDRSHMRDAAGNPTQPPPPWRPPTLPSQPMNLMRFVDVDDDIAGVVVDAAGLIALAERPR